MPAFGQATACGHAPFEHVSLAPPALLMRTTGGTDQPTSPTIVTPPTFGQLGRISSARSSPDQTRQCPCSSVLAIPQLPARIQAKLTVGAANDPLEHEADRVADHVMRMS